MPLRRRCTLSITASILAGYGTPAAMAVVDGMGAMQAAGAQDKIQYRWPWESDSSHTASWARS